MAIFIQPVASVEECRIIEQLQLEIWGCSELEVVPDHMLLTIAKEGGVVLLARDQNGTPVGFAYGFVALGENNRPKLASHQAGVLPDYQDQGVGYELKLAQREATLDLGIDLITWTFDPIHGRNARFNLRKLGAVGHTYLRNLYGSMRDELNQGLPSDRIKLEWWLASEHVIKRINEASPELWLPESVYPVVNVATIQANGLLQPPDAFELPHSDTCLVEIPPDIQYLKLDAPDLALRWRLQTRQIFEMLFERGYTAIDLLRREGRNFYLLQKDWQKR